MSYIFSLIMFGESVLAFYYSTEFFRKKDYQRLSSVLFSGLAFASGIWSLGYAMMFQTNSFKVYEVFRIVGMMGIILSIIMGQICGGFFTNRIKQMLVVLIPEVLIGLNVVHQMSLRSNYRMKMTSAGIETEFTTGGLAIYYTGYLVVIAIVFLVLSIRMARRSELKQNQAVGKALLVFFLLVIIGMVIDTVLPAVGINLHIPASTILQFVGIVIFHNAIAEYNRNTLSVENVTNYVYLSYKTPVFVFDTKSKLKLTNAAADDLLVTLGFDKDTDGDFWEIILKREKPDKVEQMSFEIAFDKDKKALTEDDNENENGVYYMRFTLDPVINEYNDCLGYVLVVTDITDHIKNAKLSESANLKTQFLANMSHEIRTPLNAILGFNDAIIQNPSDAAKVKSYSKSIHEAGDNLKEIINSILDISKIELGQLEIESKEYSSIEVLDNVASMFEMLAKNKGLSFKAEVDERIPSVMIGDEAHLRQVLTNILSNAVKYTDEGSVKLKVELIEHNNPIYKMRFSVEDTGRGIRDEDREKLFAKFERLDTEHFKHVEGTGLGMSIVRLTLKAMNSEIKLDSVYGKGSTFYFDLEQVALDPEAIGDFEERRKESAHKDTKGISFRAPKANVLIVDDVEMNIDAACALLEFTRMNIDKATSGQAAIEAVKKNHYDLIFMDHMMPEMDGIQATEAIRNLCVEMNDAYYASVPIIALTANAIVGMREMYQNAGMQDFVSKPIEVGAIITVLNKWLPDECIESAEDYPEEPASQDESVSEGWEMVIEGINVDEAKKYNASLDGLKRNMQSFVKAYESNRAEIEKYFEAGDAHNFVVKVHGLKSTSKMIGAMELSECARENEEDGNNEILTKEKYEKVLSLYDECVANLKAYFGMADESESQNNQDAISDEEYKALLEKILTAADGFDAMAFMSLEDELDKIVVAESYKEDFDQIKEMVSMLSFGPVSDFIKERI